MGFRALGATAQGIFNWWAVVAVLKRKLAHSASHVRKQTTLSFEGAGP